MTLPPWVGAVLFGWIFLAALGAFIFGRLCAVNKREDDPYEDPKSYGDYPFIESMEDHRK